MRVLLLASFAGLAFLAVACEGEPVTTLSHGVATTTTRPPPKPPPTPEEVQEVERCDDLVEVGILFVESMIQSLESGLSIEALTGEDPAPPDIELLYEIGKKMDQRAARLECDLDELNGEIVAGVGGIETNDPVIALFLEIVRSGIVSFLGEPAITAP